jgi:predicted Rossmann fold flavoprotein
MQSVGVIGAGAAGLMCVATLIDWWYTGHVTLYEKNAKVWAKVLISGGWRCNVTTWTYQRKQLLLNYPRGSEFLDYSFRKFGPRQVRKWFEDHNVALKQEADGRIFPVSDHGWDVVGVFTRMMNAYPKMMLSTGMKVNAMSHDNNTNQFTVVTDEWSYTHDTIVVTTWWQAYAHTGSTGDGYAFARSCGHTITELWPSLNSFVTQESRHTECSGTVFEDALVIHKWNTARWPILLTHFGLSGPGMFIVASQIPFVSISTDSPYSIYLVPHAAMRYEQWTTRFQEKRVSDPKQSIRVWLTQWFTKRMSETICKQYGWMEHTFTQLSKQHIKWMAKALGEWMHFHVVKRRPGDEFVTAWGVVTDEVDTKTMESKTTPWLYFAWEVLNVDGVTGGYNLQASRATWRLAGQSILATNTKNG